MTVKLVIRLIFLSVVFSAIKARPQQRIFNGFEVKDIRQFPWNAYLDTGCSASIIGRRKILTAAHCTCGQSADQFKVMTGATNVSSADGRWYQVLKVYEHPDYAAWSDCRRVRPNDVAILQTKSDIMFDAKVQPIEIEFNRIAYETPVINMGYGSDGWTSGVLRYANNKAWNCAKGGGMMLCTSRMENSIFFGDSGGPIVTCSGQHRSCRQIGINSGGGGSNAYYTSAYEQGDFIKKYMEA